MASDAILLFSGTLTFGFPPSTCMSNVPMSQSSLDSISRLEALDACAPPSVLSSAGTASGPRLANAYSTFFFHLPTPPKHLELAPMRHQRLAHSRSEMRVLPSPTGPSVWFCSFLRIRCIQLWVHSFPRLLASHQPLCPALRGSKLSLGPDGVQTTCANKALEHFLFAGLRVDVRASCLPASVPTMRFVCRRHLAHPESSLPTPEKLLVQSLHVEQNCLFQLSDRTSVPESSQLSRWCIE